MTMGSPEVFATAPIPIAANKEFRFLTGHSDARFAQNRDCFVEASFQPAAGRKYRGALDINGDVGSCSLKLFDITQGTEEPVPVAMPPRMCRYGGLELANGAPFYLNWEVEVQTVPAGKKK